MTLFTRKRLRLILPVVVFLFSALTGFGQRHHRVVRWTAVVLTSAGKIKDVLYDVTDSSVIVMSTRTNKHYREYLFRDIRKIKLHTAEAMDGMRVIGVAVGIYAGAFAGYLLVDGFGRRSTQRDVVDLLGGMSGAVVGGIAGGVLGPSILGGLFSRKYIVHHDAASYAELAAKLRPVSIQGQSLAGH